MLLSFVPLFVVCYVLVLFAFISLVCWCSFRGKRFVVVVDSFLCFVVCYCIVLLFRVPLFVVCSALDLFLFIWLVCWFTFGGSCVVCLLYLLLVFVFIFLLLLHGIM